MSKKIYFGIEDKKGKASYQFWTSFMQELFPQVIVESKNNCSELVKATRKITDDGNCYIIAFDNADVLLSDEHRKFIALDDRNQYLIIGRNPRNLFATSDNLFELKSDTVDERTTFTLVPFLER